MPIHLPYALVSRLLGFFLLTAAGLKAYGLAADAVSPLGLFSAPAFQVGVIQLEVFLALWLIACIQPVGSWLVTLATFASFAAIIFYLGWKGQGETRQALLELANRTDQCIRIIGGTSDCSCVATANLPVKLAPGEACSLPVKLRFPRSSGIFTRKAILITDDVQARTIPFRLMGQVRNLP